MEHNLNVPTHIYITCSDFFTDDWRADGYRWFEYGSKYVSRKDPVFKKVHFATVLQTGQYDRRFRRQVFLPLHDDHQILIHYLGDETVAEDFPHGNSKSQNRNFTRTCPSVLKKLATVADLPSNVYKEVVANNNYPPELQPALLPRNSAQIANLQQRERQKLRLTHDALYNAHELAYDMDGFVKTMTTYPDLILICGLTELTNELNLLLQIESEQPQLLSYDTTFQLGDFYISPFLFRHTLFRTSPVVPALFLIHERKYQRVHEAFLDCLAELVPNLKKGKCNVPLVTDEEVGINKVWNNWY